MNKAIAVEGAFSELRDRLNALEKRLNPKGENLHFAPRLARLKPKDFSELLDLAEDGLSKVREHENYFLAPAGSLYDDGGFWYELFTLISTASLNTPLTEEVPEPILRRLVEVIVEISQFATAGGGGDIEKRNHEALGNLFCGFRSPALRTLARRHPGQSRRMSEFVARTIRAAEGAIPKDDAEAAAKGRDRAEAARKAWEVRRARFGPGGGNRKGGGAKRQ